MPLHQVGDPLVQPLAGHEWVLQQCGYGVCGVGHRRVAQDRQRPGRGVLDQTHRRVEHDAEGALGADQEAVEPTAVLWQQVLEGVAGHLAPEAAELGAGDLEVPVDRGASTSVVEEPLLACVEDALARPKRASRNHWRARHRAVGQQHGQRLDVVHGAAVAEGARAAGVVADHPADRAAGVRRRVRAEPQAGRDGQTLQRGVHDSGLHPCGARLPVELEHPVQVPAGVDHDPGTDRVAGDGGAGAPHRERRAVLARDGERGRDLVGSRGRTTTCGGIR